MRAAGRTERVSLISVITLSIKPVDVLCEPDCQPRDDATRGHDGTVPDFHALEHDTVGADPAILTDLVHLPGRFSERFMAERWLKRAARVKFWDGSSVCGFRVPEPAGRVPRDRSRYLACNDPRQLSPGLKILATASGVTCPAAAAGDDPSPGGPSPLQR